MSELQHLTSAQRLAQLGVERDDTGKVGALKVAARSRRSSSGLSWEYFLMLCGIDGVKADRHIRSFVAEAVDAPDALLSGAQARALVIAASDELGIDSRVADYAIWNAMSGR